MALHPVVQVVSAYESDPAQDNDIDVGENGSDGVDDDFPFLQQNWTLGYAAQKAQDGPAFIYHEEIRDVTADAKMKNNPPIAFAPDVTSIIVAHEVMHRFLGRHNQGGVVTNSGLMNGIAAMQGGSTILNGIQVQYVQTRDYPR